MLQYIRLSLNNTKSQSKLFFVECDNNLSLIFNGHLYHTQARDFQTSQLPFLYVFPTS